MARQWTFLFLKNMYQHRQDETTLDGCGFWRALSDFKLQLKLEIKNVKKQAINSASKFLNNNIIMWTACEQKPVNTAVDAAQ